MESISEETKIYEVPESNEFVVSWKKVDKLSAEEFIGNSKGLIDSVAEARKRLSELDNQKEIIKKTLEHQVEADGPKADLFSAHLDRAKAWQAQNRLKAERAGKEPVEQVSTEQVSE